MRRKLRDFIAGLTAATELHNRAGKMGAFIESVCLGATVIDAALRMGLILKHQLTTGSSDLLEELLFQEAEDKVVSERRIYKRARDQGVIDEALFSKLENLYQQRNRVVHRYIISELTTSDVLNIALDYENTIQEVSVAVGKLENEQIRNSVGITRSEEVEFELAEFLKLAADKHGNEGLAARLRGKNV